MSAVARVFALDLVAKALLALTGIVLIRALSSEEYAQYTFAVALVVLATEALVGTWRSVYVAGQRRFGAAHQTGVFLSAQLMILAAAVLATVTFSDAANGLYWVIVAIVGGRALVELARGSFQRALKFTRFAGVELARAALLCVSVVGAAFAIGDALLAWHALWLEAIGLLVLGSYLLLKQRGFVGVSKVREAASLLGALAQGQYRYLGAYLIVLAMFGQVDVLMLRMLGSELALATYGSTLRYYALLSMALAAVHAVFLPLAQRVESADDLSRMLASHKKMVVAFALVALASMAVAGWLIPLVDGGAYPDAVLAFRILALSSIVSFTFSPYVNLLIRFEDFRFMLRLLAIGLVVDVALNLALIPRLGAAGAALGTALATGLITTSIFVRSRRFRHQLGGT